MVIADSELVLQVRNHFTEATKHLIVSGTKLEDKRVTGNYCIAMKTRFSKLCRRFDVQNNISFEEIKNLALSIESTKEELKTRIDEMTAVANVAEKRRVFIKY